ncbi:MAG: dTDP-4-dehydrorhamnose 3,5-epimerase [Pseudomonadota bacterium]
MRFTETRLKGAYLIEIEPIEDERGFFARNWCQKEFAAHRLNASFVQCNFSYNKKIGTLRGMHYQRGPHAEIKLVSCTAGAIYDVIIDLRQESSTFRQWIGEELTAQNHKMVYIPEGFAHGFQTLTDHCTLLYLHTGFYQSDREGRIRYNDPVIGISWPIEVTCISEKDLYPPLLSERFKGLLI